MFEQLISQPSDKIMELMAQYAEDNRTNKLDLGVGVYKNAACLLYTSPSPRDS